MQVHYNQIVVTNASITDSDQLYQKQQKGQEEQGQLHWILRNLMLQKININIARQWI